MGSRRDLSCPGSPSTVGVSLTFPRTTQEVLLPIPELGPSVPTAFLYENLHTPSSTSVSKDYLHQSLPFRSGSYFGLTRGLVDLPSSPQVSPEVSPPKVPAIKTLRGNVGLPLSCLCRLTFTDLKSSPQVRLLQSYVSTSSLLVSTPFLPHFCPSLLLCVNSNHESTVVYNRS